MTGRREELSAPPRGDAKGGAVDRTTTIWLSALAAMIALFVVITALNINFCSIIGCC